MNRRAELLINDFLLLLTAAIWGFAFAAQRAGMEHVGPFTYNAVRFALGSLVLLPLVILRTRRHPGPAAISPSAAAPVAAPPSRRIPPLAAGVLAGGILFFGASLQQAGLVYTTAGKAGFITGLYVVLVPLTGLLWGQRAGWSAWSGAVLSVVGLFLLSFTESLHIDRGDLLVLIGAIFWTGHIHVIGWLSPRTDPVRLACAQFAVCAVLSAAVALPLEHPTLGAVVGGAVPILYGGFLSVGVAFTLQVVAQRRSPPAHAAIILTLESVFAAVGGALLLGERLGSREVVGCALMFAGMLVSQLPILVRRAALQDVAS